MKGDDWERLLQTVFLSGGSGVIVGVAKGVVRRYGGIWSWIALLVASALVSVLVGLAIQDSGLSYTQKSAVIGICAYLAEDILLGIGMLAGLFARDPIRTIRLFWDALRGKSKPLGSKTTTSPGDL